MKLLLVHSDFIEYRATKKALKSAADLAEADMAGRMEECLCAFVSVEKADEQGLDNVLAKAAAEIVKVADQVKTKRVMLYPYAHLSSSLAPPPVAMEALPKLKAALPADYEVKASPFGWYKAFSISCKGHPLSELSRHVLPDGVVAGSVDVSAAQAQAKSSAKADVAGSAPSAKAAVPSAGGSAA
ncbi:MAG TPA: threonyl-tRNA synthetase editing domain-containing protein, partial [Candidatus Thermoplasmatota archaeon]|nr:threonyl-tRNA synthetase editing domain-containing protein [Candidatus Thermoplasmatota archaeon]